MADLQKKIRDLVRQESENRGAGYISMASMPDINIPEPAYPCLYLDKAIAGLDKVGKKINLKVKARVKAIRQEKGSAPKVDIEIIAIKSDGVVTGFEEADQPVGLKRAASSVNNATGVEDGTGWEDSNA